MTQSLLDLLGAEDEREFEKGWSAMVVARSHAGRRGSRPPAPTVCGEHTCPTTASTEQSSRRKCEPQVTRLHVSNALTKSLTSKVYGAHHLRQQTAIVARRQERLNGANSTVTETLRNQKNLVDRSAELRQEMAAVQVGAGAAVLSLSKNAERLDTNLERLQVMQSSLAYMLQSQSVKLQDVRDSIADVDASRPQPSTDADSAQGHSTVPGPVRLAGSADAWSVQLAVQDMINDIAGEEESQRAATRHGRCEQKIQDLKLEVEQLQGQLADVRQQTYPRLDYDTCAKLRNNIADLMHQLDWHLRRSSPEQVRALEKLGVDEEPEEPDEHSWRNPPPRQVVALPDGSLGLPVDDVAMINALAPFDGIQLVSNPLDESKIAVRSGPSAQHLLFGETYSARWQTVRAMVWGLVERAIETAPAHKPPKATKHAVWEWRDNAGCRPWHQFDSNLSEILEVRFLQLISKQEAHSVGQRDAGPEVKPEAAAEVRWTEPQEGGGSATFIVDLERMLQYPARNIVMKYGAEALPCTTLVREMVAPQPIATSGQDLCYQRMHPLVRAVAKEVRRRVPSSVTKRKLHRNPYIVARSTSDVHHSTVLKEQQPKRVIRTADAIRQTAIEAMKAEAERLGRRDRALPVGTRLWVQGIGYCWYESYRRNPQWSGARRQGPATHKIRVMSTHTDSGKGASVKPTASILHEIHLVGPDAPAWSVEPPVCDGDHGGRGRGGRLDGNVVGSCKWHSHRTVMGLPYTRYEFSRYQMRQEQVGKRDIKTEPRFWMDTTAYDAVEELPGVGRGDVDRD